jgi:hypothetical protein
MVHQSVSRCLPAAIVASDQRSPLEGCALSQKHDVSSSATPSHRIATAWGPIYKVQKHGRNFLNTPNTQKYIYIYVYKNNQLFVLCTHVM